MPVRRLLMVEDEPMVAALLNDSLTSEGFDIRTAGSAAEVCSNAIRHGGGRELRIEWRACARSAGA